MNNKYISSVHIQKLGHNILEIRERALESIISKLERGFVYDNELARSKEILSKLFDWFLVEPCTKENKVLHLIKHILLTESGQTLIKHYGPEMIVSELNKIRTYIEPQYHETVDDIVNVVTVHEIPPLQSTVPLSYRSGDTTDDQPRTVESTARTFQGFVSKCATDEDVGLGQNEVETSVDENNLSNIVLPYYTLSWQPLIAPDRHVLETVEDSLKNPREAADLLHYCEFFTDVMLQDYPAEVFLQRPSILLIFQNLLQTCTSTRITDAIFNCLLKLSELLIIRVHYYNDPCMHNFKHAIQLQNVEFSQTKPAENAAFSESSLSSDDSENAKDVETLQANQMSLPKFCLTTISCVLSHFHEKPRSMRCDPRKSYRKQSCANTGVSLLENLVKILKCCVTCEFWYELEGNADVIEVRRDFYEVFFKFGEVLEYFRVEANAESSLLRLRLVYFCADVLQKLLPLERADKELPINLKKALGNLLVNPVLLVLHSDVHETLLRYVEVFGEEFQKESLRNYKNVKVVCKSMTSFVKFFKNYKRLSINETVKLANEALPSLQFHKKLWFIESFVETSSAKLSCQNITELTKNMAKNVLLSLLSHPDRRTQLETYKLCHKKIADTIGPKLNTTKSGKPGTQILFLLEPEIFIEISSYGTTHDDLQIRNYAQDILVHVLKSKILVADSVWLRAVEAIVPSLPILLCHVGKSTSLGRTLLGALDPDAAKSLSLPVLDVVKGNVEVLFAEDQRARGEAASRLCWLLASQDESRGLLPRVNNLQDGLLAGACRLRHVIDVNKFRNTEHFYQASNLQQVLDLLKSPKVEPVIRRSALTQVSVMTEDNLLHRVFLQNDGLSLILKVMKASLTEQDYTDYPDSVIPAISILKNLCLYNASVRRDLGADVEVYYCVLRGLFMFVTEERVKQDASVLLFLLIFGVFVRGCPSVASFSVPAIVSNKLICPFLCNEHAGESENAPPLLSDSLVSEQLCLSALQIHWSLEWYGGLKELLKWDDVKSDTNDFDEILRLTTNDLNLLKNSSLEHCIRKYLMNVQNCTSHLSVIEATNNLTGYIHLLKYVKVKVMWKGDNVLDLPWENTFSKFLMVLPSGDEDVLLLSHVLKFLCALVPLYKIWETNCWVGTFLKDANHSLFDLLQSDLTPESYTKSLNKHLLNLITLCVCQEQHYIDHQAAVTDTKVAVVSLSWRNVIEIIADNLKFSDSQHFYNLAYLDSLLSALVHLTGSLGWSLRGGSKEVFRQLIPRLCELVIAFYFGKGTSAAYSLMGLSITRHVLLVLNHLVAEMHGNNVKGWELFFLTDDDSETNVLTSLWTLKNSRDAVLRAAVLQLFSGLSVRPRLALEIVRECSSDAQGVWEIALGIFLDSDEASIVRENAAMLLVNLSSHVIASNSVDSNKKGCKAVDEILELLDENNFYKELSEILSRLFTRSVFSTEEDALCDDKPLKIHKETDKEFACVYSGMRSYLDTTGRSSSSKSSERGAVVVVTPGVAKSAALFVHNLLVLAPRRVCLHLQERGVLKLFFRCLCSPLMELRNTKELALYCEIVEMNAVLCAVLNRAVTSSQVCLGTVLHTRDCLNVVVSFLKPATYYTHLPQLVYLRNRLWGEVFGLIGALLESGVDERTPSDRSEEALAIISSTLSECGAQPFLQTLCEAIGSSDSRDLQESALSSLTSLLRVEGSSSGTERSVLDSCSMQSMLDTVRTPRTSSDHRDYEEDAENRAPVRAKSASDCKISLLEKVYFGTAPAVPRRRDKFELSVDDGCDEPLAGAKICKILLRLYDLNSLNKASVKRRTIVTNTLASVLCVSREAKRYALQSGLLEILHQQLRELHIKLSLESVESLNRATDKRRVSPLLKDLDALIGLHTNFMVGDSETKSAAAAYGLADLVHKLWLWISVQRECLVNTLKMLCTFTTACADACLSFTLTSAVAGAGLRKVPCNESLVHVVTSLITKEMDQVSRSRNLVVLELSFQVLHNCCAVVECRVVLAKSHFLQSLSRLHPAITKRQKPWESVELIWLEFLATFTGYVEGQSCVGKITDALEIVTVLAGCPRAANRRVALSVLRNVAFYQSNRPRLLASTEFLNVLDCRLGSGSDEERNMVVTIVWTLAANCQKAKLVLKCARLDERLQEVLKQCHVLKGSTGLSEHDLERMQFVLNLLRDGDKNR